MFSYDTDSGIINLFDEIGPDWAGMIGMEVVSESLAAMNGKDITVYLSTPGGSVDVGTDIFNAFERYKGKKTFVVDAIAASMGSYLLQVADVRVVSENSKLMIHNPWVITFGDEAMLRKEADILAMYKKGMLPAYAERSKKSQDEVSKLMDEESWYLGAEIVSAGFADKVAGKAKNAIDMKRVAFWSHKAIPESVAKHEQERGISIAEAKASRVTLAQAKEMAASVRA